jgi:hypothetical protein
VYGIPTQQQGFFSSSAHQEMAQAFNQPLIQKQQLSAWDKMSEYDATNLVLMPIPYMPIKHSD